MKSVFFFLCGGAGGWGHSVGLGQHAWYSRDIYDGGRCWMAGVLARGPAPTPTTAHLFSQHSFVLREPFRQRTSHPIPLHPPSPHPFISSSLPSLAPSLPWRKQSAGARVVSVGENEKEWERERERERANEWGSLRQTLRLMSRSTLECALV